MESFRRVPTPLLLTALAGLLLLVLLFAAAFSSTLGSRALNPASSTYGRYVGPASVAAGQPAVVTWFVSPGQPAYPSVKIELCRGRLFGQRCVTINPDTPNDGASLVFIPRLAAGPAALRLTPRRTPQGQLLPRFSIAGDVTVVGRSSARTIGPANVGGGAIFSLTPAGPRVAVSQGTSYDVFLPDPITRKKVEICWRDGARDRCRTLATAAVGASAHVTMPTIPPGRAYLKVSERGDNGLLTGRIFYQRALLVTPPRLAQQPRDNGGDSGGGDSGGGGGGGESRGGGSGQGDASGTAPTPPVAPPQVAGASAQFTLPTDGSAYDANANLDVWVLLTETSSSRLRCQQWLLDGRTLTSVDWVGGQSPDLSDGPCQ